MRKVTVSRSYNGGMYPVDPVPAWLQDRISKALPFLNPRMLHTRLVCADNPWSIPQFGENVPCNDGYLIDIDWVQD